MVDVVFDGGPWDGQAQWVLADADGHPRDWLQVPSPDPGARQVLYAAAEGPPGPGEPWRYEYVGTI